VSHGLGCGRKTPGAPIKYHPGIVLRKKPGEKVTEGEVILEVHHDGGDTSFMGFLKEAVKIVPKKLESRNVVYKIV